MTFRTKLDFSSNRQVKQHEATTTILSGGTSFGLTFSALTTGPDLTTSGVSENYTLIASTFSGNTGTTVYTWYDARMNLAINALSAITSTNSATTQTTGQVYTPSSTIVIDGYTVNLAYTGVSFDITGIAMIDLGGGNYSGTVTTNNLDILSCEISTISIDSTDYILQNVEKKSINSIDSDFKWINNNKNCGNAKR